MSAQTKGEKVFRGIAVSAGICRGKILVLHRARHVIAKRELSDPEIAAEVNRFEKSLVQTRQQISEVQRKVVENMGTKEGDIFEAHLLMLEDRMLVDEVIRIDPRTKDQCRIRLSRGVRALRRRAGGRGRRISPRTRRRHARPDRARAGQLARCEGASLTCASITEPCILVGHDLSPSTTAQLDKKLVLGFATDIGGKTSHTAIMARSLGIPAVVGLKTASEEFETGDYALLDGYNGTVIVNPTDQTLFEYGQLSRIKASLEEKLQRDPKTARRHARWEIHPLSANIEDQNDIEAVIANGAEGVGLFRTEFLFINRESLPSEEEPI